MGKAENTDTGRPLTWVDRTAQRVLGLGIASVFVFVGVVLYQAYFAPHGLSYRASSAYAGWATEGNTSESRPYHMVIHTEQEPAPWFELDLGKIRRISTVEVTNRTDCCQNRAVPLEISVRADADDWKVVATREHEFRIWKAEFEPVNVRFIRLTVKRPSVLHLQRVEAW